MNEKTSIIIVFIIGIICIFSGCATKPAGTGAVDYIKPATVEAAQYGIDERIESLERTLGDCRSEIEILRKSCDTIINAGGRSGDLIQETLELAQALYSWVNWAYNRLRYLENLLADQIQD